MHNIQFSPASQLAFRDITYEKAEVLWPRRRFIRVRSSSLWPADWGGISCPHWVGKYLSQYLRSHFGEVKTPGSFWLKAQFQNTHTNKLKSQCLWLPHPRSRWGSGTEGVQSAGWRAVFCPSSAMNRKEKAEEQALTIYQVLGGSQ